MKIRQTVLLLAIMASFVPFNEASASGNVLLPPENSDKSNLPNLGLIPAEPAPTPPVASKPAEAPKPPPPVAATKPVTTPVSKPPAFYVPRNNLTPKPYTITISLAKPAWSENDIDAVNKQLGVAKTRVPAECQMAINGSISSDAGLVSVTGNTTTSATIAYDGTITRAMLTVYAVCNSAPKPATYTYMQHFGDKFGIPIGSTFCTPSTPTRGTMRQVVMTHPPKGTDSCAYVP